MGGDDELLFSILGADPDGGGGCIEGGDTLDDTDTGIVDTELVVCSGLA